MKITQVLIALAALRIQAAAAEPNTLSAEEQSAGWKLLFDGKTTNGWVAIGKQEFPAKGWTVLDGTLFHPKGAGGGDIVTKEAFENFELTWEWRIAEGANGGLKYNLVDPKKAVGCEYQLIDDANHPDSKAHGSTRLTAGLYDVLAPAADKKLHPAGAWNHSRILVRGNHAEHWLNGGKTVEFEFGSDALKTAVAESKFKTTAGWGTKTKSPILLQDHGDEVAVRNVKVRTTATN